MLRFTNLQSNQLVILMPVPSASGPSSSLGIQMLDQIGQGGLCAPDGAEGLEASGKDGEKPSHRAELGEFRTGRLRRPTCNSKSKCGVRWED